MLKQNCIAVTTIKRLRFRNSLTKTFSYADFSNCQCPQILASMYNQLIEHCEGSGRYFTRLNLDFQSCILMVFRRFEG